MWYRIKNPVILSIAVASSQSQLFCQHATKACLPSAATHFPFLQKQIGMRTFCSNLKRGSSSQHQAEATRGIEIGNPCFLSLIPISSPSDSLHPMLELNTSFTPFQMDPDHVLDIGKLPSRCAEIFHFIPRSLNSKVAFDINKKKELLLELRAWQLGNAAAAEAGGLIEMSQRTSWIDPLTKSVGAPFTNGRGSLFSWYVMMGMVYRIDRRHYGATWNVWFVTFLFVIVVRKVVDLVCTSGLLMYRPN